MYSAIRPNQFIALRLPSDLTKIVQLVPNTYGQCPGKYGSFPANQIIGRPFYLTFEISNEPEEDGSILRIVHAAELHAETLISEGSGEADGEGDDAEMDGDVPIRSNRDIVDTASTQKLTLDEIEALKKESAGAGREIVAKLLESHSAIDQKTAFSLAKYKLRKRKKYIKRFTALPVDVSLLTNYMLYEKDAPRTLELRDELIGLLGCWGNVHHDGNLPAEETVPSKPSGRYLVVDDTGGLVVAAMAERMGILYPDEEEAETRAENVEAERQQTSPGQPGERSSSTQRPQRPPRPQPMSASGNSITVLHAHATPSLALLRYFGYDHDNPDESHPLYTHLKSVSWMQLVDPESDPIYANEPPAVPDSELATYKTNKRSAYYRKRNRWARVRSIVDESRAGEFDGLIVASVMEPISILKHAVPLLSGSAPVVVYSPTIEPLTELAELYSTPRRTAYITRKRELEERARQESEEQPLNGSQTQGIDLSELEEDFPVDPTLLLAPTLQTSRVRPWQVLPGRTHPLMSGRGGAEGYIFHATRVLRSRETIQAAGFGRKRRKIETVQTPNTTSGGSVDAEMGT